MFWPKIVRIGRSLTKISKNKKGDVFFETQCSITNITTTTNTAGAPATAAVAG